MPASQSLVRMIQPVTWLGDQKRERKEGGKNKRKANAKAGEKGERNSTRLRRARKQKKKCYRKKREGEKINLK